MSDYWGEAPDNLRENEKEWVKLEGLFKARGYNFRPRFRNGWIPSWYTTGTPSWKAEDAAPLTATRVIDAHTDDGKWVAIKRIDSKSEEAHITQMLNTEEMLADPRNHCVPVIEVIEDPNDGAVSYMVMPLLRRVQRPPFEFIKEIVDFVDQVFEGLVFIHEKGVAHRDCVMHNFLMDAEAMYPEGFHPTFSLHKRDFSGIATSISRSVVGVRYYFTDFGMSVHIPEDDPNKTVTGDLGRDEEAPELSNKVPYDPFKLDIFMIGNMFKKELCDKFINTEFLRPLVKEMTKKPEERPTAKEARSQWLKVRKGISFVSKEWRPRPRDEDILCTVVLDSICLFQIFWSFPYTIVRWLRRW